MIQNHYECMNQTSPIVDSKFWTPCSSWSENLTDKLQYITKDKLGNPVWKPSFNPFSNTTPSYEIEIDDDEPFDFINGKDPWNRPFVKSIFHPIKGKKWIAYWRIRCGTSISCFLDTYYNCSRNYVHFSLMGFTSVNKEVVRLCIKGVTSNILDQLIVTNPQVSIDYAPASSLEDRIVDDRNVPLWIV